MTASGRCLPDFIIIGAQRCGTTSLHNYLADHPKVLSAFMKETHFFDLHFRQGVSWYRAHFPFAGTVRREGLVVGEATPYYLFYPHAPRRVHAVVPDARLIVLLRNPVDRAYSHYHHEVQQGVERESFEQALDRENELLSRETDRILRDETYRSFAHFHYSYLSRGIYVDQLERWAQYFRRDQMLLLRSEDLYRDPAATVARALEFLGLPPWRSGEYGQYNVARYPEMDPATRKRLIAYFRPHNERLYAYLGTDFGWDS